MSSFCARLLLLVPLLTASLQAQAEERFQTSSRADGKAFDIVVNETVRQPRRSEVQVTGYRRSDEQARYLLCALARLAQSRGFSHLMVLGPGDGDGLYVVGGFTSRTEPLESAFGTDYPQLKAISSSPGEVEKLIAFCSGSSPP